LTASQNNADGERKIFSREEAQKSQDENPNFSSRIWQIKAAGRGLIDFTQGNEGNEASEGVQPLSGLGVFGFG